MSDIWDGVESYRVPEWDPKWISEGVKFTHITKDLAAIRPLHHEKLLAAIADGTAQARPGVSE